MRNNFLTVAFWELRSAEFLHTVSVTLEMSLGVNYYKEQLQKRTKCEHIFL